MEARNSFVFYRSFYEAIRQLEASDQTLVMQAICEYALDGREPELSGVPAAIFMLVKPNLDANSRKFANGKKGGRPKKRQNQAETKPEPNGDEDEDEDVNEDVNADGGWGREDEESSSSAATAAVECAYRKKINQRPSGQCLRELRGWVGELGEAICLRAIDEAMDAQKPSWPYIRAILQAKKAQGVHSLADWDALEERRKKPDHYKSWVELAEELEARQ